jgi:transcriptional regulator with XRE-family HTH domain
MHWIETIREHLQITREELSFYLQLSVHTVKAVELGRRSLPQETLMAAAALYDEIRNAQIMRVTVDAPPPAFHHMQGAKHMHRQCRRKLDRSVDKLEKMKKSYATACFSLGVYQTLAQSLSAAVSKEDQARLVWAQRQIRDTSQCIQDTNPTAQHLLAAEIVGLKDIVHSLDLIQLNSEHHTPLPKGPVPSQP